MRLSTLTPFLILIFTVATHAAVKVALKTTKGVTVASNNPVDQTGLALMFLIQLQKN